MVSGKKWFMVKHNECDAVFTIDMETFYNSFESDASIRTKEIICPNCGKIAMNSNKVDSLFKIFNEKVSLSKELTITELREEDLKDELTTRIIRALKGN